MTPFLVPLAKAAAVLLAASAAGWLVGDRLFPGPGGFQAERLAGSLALGCALITAMVAVCLPLHLTPGWIPFLVLGAVLLAVSRLWPMSFGPGKLESARGPSRTPPQGPKTRALSQWTGAALGILLVLGIGLYALRALTEPMWSNDFLAIWGLKGKTIFFTRSIPPSLRWPAYGFSHPEYPLGLPFLYAGVAFLTARWDDHALAVLFPAIQAATLLALYAWLRRRGASPALSLGAAALLSLFKPLYSSFSTGLADVPFSAAALLFGTALSDSLDETDAGAIRRLGVASLLAAGIKNEGLFLAAAGAVAALFSSSARRRPAAGAAMLPAVAIVGLQRLLLGSAPLRDLDFAFLGPRISELPGRLAESLRAALSQAAPAWPSLLALALLFAAGRPAPYANRILAVAAVCLAAYALLPALAVLGPTWLISTSFLRTASALAPMAAAGITARLTPAAAGASSAASEDRAASAARDGPPKPSTPAS
jgi:hypothetical protein